MYQELSEGMLAFLENEKIADVPFPFPYAQMLNVLVLSWSFFVPVWVACFTQSMFAGPIITFMIFQSVWCIQEVARDLENPFGDDANDIPLYDFHKRFCVAMQETHRALDVVHDGKTDGIGDDDVSVGFFGDVVGPTRALSPGGERAFLPHCDHFAVTPEGGDLEAALDVAAPALMVAAAEAAADAPAATLGAPMPPRTKVAAIAAKDLREAYARVEVIDRQSAQIARQIEQHLAQIACELDTLTAKVAGSPSATPSASPRTLSLGDGLGLFGCLGGLGKAQSATGGGNPASARVSLGAEQV
jgi:hypothetical protein